MMPDFMTINGRIIGSGHAPYVIAELSGNHNGNIDRAIHIMKAAKDAGADAVKLQTYTADTMTIDFGGPQFIVDLPLWKNRTLYDLYQEASTPWEWHETLFAKGADLGITIFSTPFDFTSVDFLESLKCPAYKIASPELIDLPLIEKVAATGKPMIISTGMGTVEEIRDAVQAARGAGCKELALLHCVSAYPAPPEDACLTNIAELSRLFNVQAGLSDHTLGTTVAVAAVALGATIIEKHVTLARADGGVDSAFSLEPRELQQLVAEAKNVRLACVGPDIRPKEVEIASLMYRRSLYVVSDMKKGDAFEAGNVRSIRPGFGLEPKHYRTVLNCRAACALKRGTPLSWEVIEGGGI